MRGKGNQGGKDFEERPTLSMSATAWASWLDRLESARGQEQVLSSKIRTGNSGAIGTSVFALQQSVSRLKRDFDQLKRSSGSVYVSLGR
jgi:hypothetical protein